MKPILAAALLSLLAIPSFAQTAPSLGDAVTTLSAIQKDETKRKTYCEMQDLLVQAEEASQKSDEAQAKLLTEQAEAKSKVLGDDFQKLIMIEADIDPTTEDGKRYFDAWEALEKSCAKA
jgi:hypothetical protein